MLRLHLQRLALTCTLMAAFIGGGLLFGHPPTPTSGAASAQPHAITSTQRLAPAGSVQATARDADDAEPASRAREIRRNELSWPFFSFGRKRGPGLW